MKSQGAAQRVPALVEREALERARHLINQRGVDVSVCEFCCDEALQLDRIRGAQFEKDDAALDIFCHHWRNFAERYKGTPNSALSFNLINEPSRCTVEQYERVIRTAVQAIREADSSRLVLIDGMFGEAILPATNLADIPLSVHATRGYAPFALSHFLAPWAGTPDQLPEWPMHVSAAVVWDKRMLHRWCIYPFEELKRKNVRIFVGEWGCWNKTPHQVALAWMRDFLALWKEANWGWALWCLRGSFGVLDSGRNDVAYERWRGHLLDRKMLELLRSY